MFHLKRMDRVLMELKSSNTSPKSFCAGEQLPENVEVRDAGMRCFILVRCGLGLARCESCRSVVLAVVIAGVTWKFRLTFLLETFILSLSFGFGAR